MAYDIYYSIRANVKTNYVMDTLFFGKQNVYDYKQVCNKVFKNYDDAVAFIVDNDLTNVHIRKTICTSGGVIDKDYYRGA